MQIYELQDKADQATALLKALASRNRLMILCLLVDRERSVGELARALDLRDTVVSQHLGLLRKDRLITPRREGQSIYYSLHGDAARRVIGTLYDIYCAEDDGSKETPAKLPPRGT